MKKLLTIGLLVAASASATAAPAATQSTSQAPTEQQLPFWPTGTVRR